MALTSEAEPDMPFRAMREEQTLEGVLLSVDTFQSSVAKEAVTAGADIVNDVTGGLMDPNMYSTVVLFSKRF